RLGRPSRGRSGPRATGASGSGPTADCWLAGRGLSFEPETASCARSGGTSRTFTTTRAEDAAGSVPERLAKSQRFSALVGEAQDRVAERAVSGDHDAEGHRSGGCQGGHRGQRRGGAP